MKRFLIVFSIMVTMMFFFAGCAKCISTETEKVQVTIIDCHYSPGLTQTLPTDDKGGFMIVTYPDTYMTKVEYRGMKFTFTDFRTYKNYKNKVGQTTTGVLEIRTFDDGTVKYDIIVLD